MGYYEGEKSVGLGPIVAALSVVAMLGFGLLYYLFGHNVQPTNAEELNAQQAQPEQVQTSSKPVNVKAHGRV